MKPPSSVALDLIKNLSDIWLKQSNMALLPICLLKRTPKTPEIRPMAFSWEEKHLSKEYDLKSQMFLSFVLLLKKQKGGLWVISWRSPSQRAAVLTWVYCLVYICVYIGIYDIVPLSSLEFPEHVQKARTIQDNVVGKSAKILVRTWRSSSVF